MSLFIWLLIVYPLLIWIWTLLLKKRNWIFSYMLTTAIIYLLLAAGAIFFLRNALFYWYDMHIWNLVFINQINAIFIVLILILSFVIGIYALHYFKEEIAQKKIGYSRLKEYPILINMFIFSMIITALSNNLIVTWIGLEATTIFTAFLISFYNTETSREAAWKYVIICGIWLTVGLFGMFLMLYSWLPWLNVSEILKEGIDMNMVNVPLLKFAFLFVVIGFWTKAALFPMNTWLPDAHGKAPSPVSAFMSSILLPLALYVIYRAKEILDIVIPGFANQILLVLGIITLVFSGIVLIKQKHFKRALAYSSSEHMGIIAIAFALNAPMIAFAHIIFHSFIKAAAFMSAGKVLLNMWSGKFDKIRNLFKYMKFTPILLVISLIFLMGIPPSYLFVTEIALIVKSFDYSPWISVSIILAILLATSGLLINFSKMFQGEENTTYELHRHESDFHRNGSHRAIAISLLFPLILTVIAAIWFWRIG